MSNRNMGNSNQLRTKKQIHEWVLPPFLGSVKDSGDRGDNEKFSFDCIENGNTSPSTFNTPPPPLSSSRGTGEDGSALVSRATPTATRTRAIGWARSSHCCIVIMTLKKNNVFVNVTNLKGQRSVIKFSSGLIQKKKSKKLLKTTAQWMIEKVLLVVKNNFFDCVKMVIKGQNSKSLSYLREFARGAKRKKIKIISFQNFVPIAHNGCRPPKKRRI